MSLSRARERKSVRTHNRRHHQSTLNTLAQLGQLEGVDRRKDAGAALGRALLPARRVLDQADNLLQRLGQLGRRRRRLAEAERDERRPLGPDRLEGVGQRRHLEGRERDVGLGEDGDLDVGHGRQREREVGQRRQRDLQLRLADRPVALGRVGRRGGHQVGQRDVGAREQRAEVDAVAEQAVGADVQGGEERRELVVLVAQVHLRQLHGGESELGLLGGEQRADVGHGGRALGEVDAGQAVELGRKLGCEVAKGLELAGAAVRGVGIAVGGVLDAREAGKGAKVERQRQVVGARGRDGLGRRRTSRAFDQFIDVTSLNDLEVSTMARSMEIDIAVDLKGYTKDGRLGIFADGCAPIQVNYLGYPGTIGAPYFDYIVADKTLIPPESQESYSEKVVYLPHSYQVNDGQRTISDRLFTRSELGLPDQGFVFCCFNNGYKIFPHVFDIWMRLLKEVEGSVLWLLAELPVAIENLRREAEARGVAGDRLVFAGRVTLADHLARHVHADLFLDTLPCNAHTTASDALWAGLPVLTCLGQGLASRVAGSVLTAMDLPELITTDLAAYEAKALHFATHPDDLRNLKAKVAIARSTSPLFKAQVFARHIEAAYLAMEDRRRAGLGPDHIEIPA